MALERAFGELASCGAGMLELGAVSGVSRTLWGEQVEEGKKEEERVASSKIGLTWMLHDQETGQA